MIIDKHQSKHTKTGIAGCVSSSLMMVVTFVYFCLSFSCKFINI